jgi:hypothetical protein
MKVRIVHYELGKDSWILEKFAFKLHENLQLMGINSDVAAMPDENADINHHILYYDYDGVKRGVDTLMITHIDNTEKLEMLKKQMQVADAGICMSKETVHFLAQMGVNKNGLCYVNPAHDGMMPIRKIVIGLSSRIYNDGRKREVFLERLAKAVDPLYFKFKIMGENWTRQVHFLRDHGFEVEYFERFDYNEYLRLIPSLDYYLYMGMDEGQIGFIDALSAGVKTIVTKQGFHLDAYAGISHSFTTYQELEKIFLNLQQEKATLVDSVATWNWNDYAKKHVEIWNYLLSSEKTSSIFSDGLNSLLASRFGDMRPDRQFVLKKKKELNRNLVLHKYHKRTHQIDKVYKAEGFSGIIRLIRGRVLK